MIKGQDGRLLPVGGLLASHMVEGERTRQQILREFSSKKVLFPCLLPDPITSCVCAHVCVLRAKSRGWQQGFVSHFPPQFLNKFPPPSKLEYTNPARPGSRSWEASPLCFPSTEVMDTYPYTQPFMWMVET